MADENNVLYSSDDLTITLIESETGAKITLQSTPNGPDLRSEHDVVVVIDGQGVPLDVHDSDHATAALTDWEKLCNKGFQLMIRVEEFFDGWVFDPAS